MYTVRKVWLMAVGRHCRARTECFVLPVKELNISCGGPCSKFCLQTHRLIKASPDQLVGSGLSVPADKSHTGRSVWAASGRQSFCCLLCYDPARHPLHLLCPTLSDMFDLISVPMSVQRPSCSLSFFTQLPPSTSLEKTNDMAAAAEDENNTKYLWTDEETATFLELIN